MKKPFRLMAGKVRLLRWNYFSPWRFLSSSVMRDGDMGDRRRPCSSIKNRMSSMVRVADTSVLRISQTKIRIGNTSTQSFSCTFLPLGIQFFARSTISSSGILSFLEINGKCFFETGHFSVSHWFSWLGATFSNGAKFLPLRLMLFLTWRILLPNV